MPNRKISHDLKLAALRLHQHGAMPLSDILQCLGISRMTFFRVQKIFCETGDVVKPQSAYRGRLRIQNHADVHYLIELIQHRPDWFLNELQGLLERNRFISVHYTTIHRELLRAGISLKKFRKVASERNEDLRADFIRQMARYEPEELIFIDKASKDERTPVRRYGHGPRSEQASIIGPFVHGKRLSAVAAMSTDGVIAGKVVLGSFDQVRYIEFIELFVVSIWLVNLLSGLNYYVQLPLCTRWPGKHSVLVMDNARIHHGEEICELVMQHGASNSMTTLDFLL